MRQWSVKQNLAIDEWELDNRNCLFEGSPYSGKSAIAILVLVLYSTRFQNCTFAICAYSFDLIETNVIPLLEEACEEIGIPYKIIWGRKPKARIGNNMFRFYSASSIRSRKAIHGQSFQAVFVDEVTDVPLGVLEEFRRRVRQLPKARSFFACNTEGQEHPFYVDYRLDPEAKDMNVHTLLIADNPAIPEDFIQTLLDEPDDAVRDRNVNAVWRSRRGRVYEFHKKESERPHQDDISQWALTVDPGDSSSSHALLMGLHYEDYGPPVWWVYDEWRRDWTREDERKSHDVQVDEIWMWLEDLGVNNLLEFAVCDSAAQSFRVALQNRFGIDVYDSIKSRRNVPDVIKDSTELLRRMFIDGDVRLSLNVPRLMREMTQCIWDEKHHRDRPVESGLIHGLVALRYFTYIVGPPQRDRSEMYSDW